MFTYLVFGRKAHTEAEVPACALVISWEVVGLVINTSINKKPACSLGSPASEFPPHSFHLPASGGLEAKVSDLALRQHLTIMEVWNFSLGSKFSLVGIIYDLVNKFKTHKGCKCQQGFVFNVQTFVYVWLCVYTPQTSRVSYASYAQKPSSDWLCALYCLCH